MPYRLSEQECVSLLRRVRWPESVICFHCGSGDVIRVTRTWRGCFARWQCRTCQAFFFESTGCELQHSLLPLATLFRVLEGLSDGEPPDEIERDMGLERWSVRILGPKLFACPVCRDVLQALLRDREQKAAEAAADPVPQAEALADPRPANARPAGKAARGRKHPRGTRHAPPVEGAEPAPTTPEGPAVLPRTAGPTEIRIQTVLDQYYANRILRMTPEERP